MSGAIEKRLAELGIELPRPSKPAGNYVPYVLAGNLVFVAGQVPFWNGALKYRGRVGADLGLDDATAAARICGLNLIAQVRVAAGDLERVRRCVQLHGFVCCTPDFTDQAQVINGASDLMVEVFGEAGRHARFAVGSYALPLGAPVEVAAVFEIA